MTLEFPADNLSPLARELGITDWLSRFHHPVPILGKILLQPLKEKEAKKRYQQLDQLKNQLESHALNAFDFLKSTQLLPPLEPVINAMRHHCLEQVDLHQLGAYLKQELDLLKLEEGIKDGTVNKLCIQQIWKILENFLEDDFGSIRYKSSALKKQARLASQKQKLEEEIQNLEKLIFSHCGLKLTYGYPREIQDPDENLLQRLQSTPHLVLRDEGNHLVVRIQLPMQLLQLEEEQLQLMELLNSELNHTLIKLNQEIRPFLDPLESLYQQRQVRSLHYLLLTACDQLKLTIPRISSKPIFQVKKGKLPFMEKNTKDYVPLDFEMNPGANLLVGANMSGKTTILKTLYFLATLVEYGLPVPATSLELRFPRGIHCHFPNAGNLRKNLSALGDELEFWSAKFQKGAILFVDEMFHSTDPVSGMYLTQAFIEEFQAKELFLLATTHYREALELPEPVFFRMVSNGKASVFQPGEVALENMETASLRAALKFSIPTGVKSKIRKRIQRKKN